ncbi:MAG: hypothetical protein Q3999_06085 [Buchananella hordeovulneris]|nr:hypothetical protein [Buchananella hordeovulneris]
MVIDAAGDPLRLEWIGRSDVPGVRPGASIRVNGIVVQRSGGVTMINPTYDLVLQESDE